MSRIFSICAALSVMIVINMSVISLPWSITGWDDLVEKRMSYRALVQSREWDNEWHGIPMQQYPNDLMVIQNLVNKVKPDLIIETGTYYGALSIYLAQILDGFEIDGEVVTIDIDPTMWEATRRNVSFRQALLDRIRFIEGSSIAKETLEKVAQIAAHRQRVMVILDSDHSTQHVLAELNLYSRLVTKGSFIIAQDTEHDRVQRRAGPLAAVTEFLRTNSQFTPDPAAERYLISCMHSGVLRKM